ncbi:ribonuclease H-like protein [Leucogyrophana mollusca]|uniref:Ribonuclease H-like protein n=1 Tax=Leucogyrophana mollusca TaxID=85980 RepID=A0ACB8BS95_9AGAM|nr:ribonuclease H-like protein [Leucogyrophana mollusca]
MASGKPLDFDAGPLVWVDCEMTGLDHRKDKILEVAVIITDGNLSLVDEGIQYVIRTDKAILDGMDKWCTTQHGQSGLTQACLTSPHTKEFVSQAVLDYIKKWIPQHRTGVLAGNSVHVDRIFMAEEMPDVVDWLHYRRVLDKGTDLGLWYPSRCPPKSLFSARRALDDIKGSIRELDWYRKNIFIEAPLSPWSTSSSGTNIPL